MEDYRNIMVEFGDSSKQLWPTEFGWAVSSTPQPGYEYAAINTEASRAQYVVRAYQMGKAWGWVGPMFLWNLNFRVVAPGSEQAAFGIVNNNWGRTDAYNALAGMAK
jgi:polysaccharide biosynthesis protein PslG